MAVFVTLHIGDVMKILTLDFESYDPCLLTYGMGSCLKYHFYTVPFEIVGCGLQTYDGTEEYIAFNVGNDFIGISYDLLEDHIKNHDAILCQNSLYDISILKYMYRDRPVWQDKLIIDTLLLAKHDDQSRFSYGLDALCQAYKCAEKKESDILHDYAWLSGIYQCEHRQSTGRECHTRPSKSVMNKFCMADLRRFPTDIVGEYCLQDVRATRALYDVLINKLSYLNLELDSDILKVCVDTKFNGVRIDLNKAKELLEKFKEVAKYEEDIVYRMLGCPREFHIGCNILLGELLHKKGYKLPVTKLGNLSLRAEWLKEQDDEIYTHISRYRKSLKVNEYLNKIIKYQDIIPEEAKVNGKGWLYPSLKPYGATATGRFSSGGGKGCNEISIQQIPRRDEEFGAPIRELFLPHDGENMVCGDYSGQESRLQVHHATLIGCTGAKQIAQMYIDNPRIDYHQLVADICGIERDHAKTINLGLSYGMGKTKLLNQLKVDFCRGTSILEQYSKLLPFMIELQIVVEKIIKKNGCIKLMDGSKLKLGEFERAGKALNKLVQGNAGVQCRMAMISAWKAGLKLLFSVHDEIVISSKEPIEDGKILKGCMEDSVQDLVKLEVPMYVEYGHGDNWGVAK